MLRCTETFKCIHCSAKCLVRMSWLTNSSPDGDHEPFSKAWLPNACQGALARYRDMRRAGEGDRVRADLQQNVATFCRGSALTLPRKAIAFLGSDWLCRACAVSHCLARSQASSFAGVAVHSALSV